MKAALTTIAALALVGALQACSPTEPDTPDQAKNETSEPNPAATPTTRPLSLSDDNAVLYDCAGSEVATEYRNAEDDILVELDGVVYALPPAISASGARYEGATDLGTLEFWDNGQEALLTIGDGETINCTRLDSTTASGGMSTELTGKTWLVEDLNTAGVIDIAQTTLIFSPDGRVSGSTGCNQYTGSYDIEGDDIIFSQIATTRKACPEALMNQEQTFLSVIETPLRLEFNENGALLLSGPDRSLRALPL